MFFFSGKLIKEYNEDAKSVIKNHYYSIVIGNDLIFKSSKPVDALEYYERAISSPDGNEFYAAAHAGKAWYMLKSQKISNKSVGFPKLDTMIVSSFFVFQF